MNLSTAKSLIADLERHPRRIELFTADLEAFILWTMDAVYELAKRGVGPGQETTPIEEGT